MAYAKEVKPTTITTPGAKDTDDFLKHLYSALLCEDGSYLVQEDGVQRIILEWYFTSEAEPTTANTKNAKPITTWTL